jgi:glutamine amidotransferase
MTEHSKAKVIAIVDYGMGNLHSVSKAVERLGYQAEITSDPSQIKSAQAVILPGVGAFGDGMVHLRESQLDQVIIDYVQSGGYLLGICLGMQMLFTTSEEHGLHEGLNLLPGNVVRFEGDYKVPHMGWNKLTFSQQHPLFAGVEEGHAYFVHSYHAIPTHRSDVLATTDYFQYVSAIVARDHLFGMQFHPEKSGPLGMKLLDQFLKISTSSVSSTI